MTSLVMFAASALPIAVRRRGLLPGSPPPVRAATEISRMSLVKILPRFASCAPLRCWMLAHLEWPAIAALRTAGRIATELGIIGRLLHARGGSGRGAGS